MHKAQTDVGAKVYEIRVVGVLEQRWSAWFDGMAITPLANGDTLLAGPIRDQSALHGLLNKIRDMGLTLLSVQQVGSPESYGDTTEGWGKDIDSS